MSGRTVLVTGGSGYVAGWCIVELLGQGYRVRTTVRSPAKELAVTRAVSSVIDPQDRLSFAIADLTSDDGWKAAVDGVDYVLHVAASLGAAGDADVDLIATARDGALRVLRAATAAGVQRVVMTSAANTASPSSYADDSVTDETLWTDPDDPTLIPYRRAKTLAERAAWDFMANHTGPTSLTTILPGAVFGPVLSADHLGSTDILARMLQGRMRGVPRISLEVVDVRDLADLHVRAMTAPEAAGQRFLATGTLIWMREMAQTVRSGLGADADKVSTRQIPDFAVRWAARFDPNLRQIIPALGRRNRHSTQKAHHLLGWQPRPAAETILDCGRSLIQAGTGSR